MGLLVVCGATDMDLEKANGYQKTCGRGYGYDNDVDLGTGRAQCAVQHVSRCAHGRTHQLTRKKKKESVSMVSPREIDGIVVFQRSSREILVGGAGFDGQRGLVDETFGNFENVFGPACQIADSSSYEIEGLHAGIPQDACQSLLGHQRFELRLPVQVCSDGPAADVGDNQGCPWKIVFWRTIWSLRSSCSSRSIWGFPSTLTVSRSTRSGLTSPIWLEERARDDKRT